MLAFVVDADSDHRVIVGISLAFLGYEVFQFEDGGEAIAAAQSVIPSLVLTDVFAPRRDGIAVIEAIRRQHPRCRLVAMLPTLESLSGAFRTTLEHLGADAILFKPVDDAAISTVIAKLRETPPSSSATRANALGAPNPVPISAE